MDLFNDLRCAILNVIPRDTKDMFVVSELNALPISKLLIYFLNWRNRLIHPHPRRVHRSSNLIFRFIPSKQQVDLEKLIGKISLGADLTPHLSRGIAHGFAPRKPEGKKNLGKHRDLDLLLNDWGIHHLHLSDRIDPDGFAERHDLVLFGVFDVMNTYLIDVMSHRNWSNQHLVEVAVRNWPAANLFIALKGVLGLSGTTGHPEREQLRRAGVTTAVQVDGTVYASPKFGISTTGTSIEASREASRVLRCLRTITDGIKNNPDYLQGYVEQAGKLHVPSPVYRLILLNGPHNYGFGILEEKTGAIIGI